MNSIILMGRLTGDPELRAIQGNSELTVTRFSIAVNRKYKAANEERPKTDFFPCVAWGKTGEFINKYFKKGNMIAITGSLETDSYTNKDGVKIKTTYIRVEGAEFTGEKTGSSPEETPEPVPADKDGFMSIPDGIDEELPFH